MKSKEDVNILFKQGDTDERILKSIAEDTEHEYDSEELSKALDKAKLVQKEVQVRGKNGQMHTRKQWVRAGEDQPSTKQPKAQEDTKETSSKPKQEEKKEHWTKVGTSQEAKSQIAQMLASGKSREDCMSDFKAQGVTWKEHENPAINWMRAAMAMNKHLTSGKELNESQTTKSTAKTISSSSVGKLRDKLKNGISKEDFRYELLRLQRHEGDFSDETFNLSDGELYRMFGDIGVNSVISSYKKSDLHKIVDILESGKTSDNLTKPYEPSNNDTKMTNSNFDTVVSSAKKGDIVHMTIARELDNGMIYYENFSGKVSSLSHTRRDGKPGLNIKWDTRVASPHGELNKIDGISDDSNITYYIESSNKSVIGSDYTQLTTEKESGTIEGEAHNMMVGRLGSQGKKKPTEKEIKEAANSLKDAAINEVISSYNQDELVHQLAMAKQFTKLAGGNMDHMTLENLYKDVVSGNSFYTQRQKCDALAKLCGKDYDVTLHDDVVRHSNESLAQVNIRPLSRGNFEVTFSYDDGQSYKETYDSVKSAKDAADKFIDKEDSYYQKDKAKQKK